MYNENRANRIEESETTMSHNRMVIQASDSTANVYIDVVSSSHAIYAAPVSLRPTLLRFIELHCGALAIHARITNEK